MVLLVAVTTAVIWWQASAFVLTEAGAHSTPQRSAMLPHRGFCVGQPWLQSPASSGSWGTVAVLLSCRRKDDQFRSGFIDQGRALR
jgi:hypothetical protein